MRLKNRLIYVLIILTVVFGFSFTISKANEDEFIQEYVQDYGNLQNVYVTTDLENDYYISSTIYTDGSSLFKLIKHDILNNTNEEIYTYDGMFSLKHYVRDNIIYIEGLEYSQYREGDCTGVRIIGFDINTNQIIYDRYFSDLIVKKNDEFHSFVVDSKENIYFEYEYTGIKVLNKDGNVIFDKVPLPTSSGDREKEVVLHSISPNDDGLFFSIGEYSFLPNNYVRTINTGYQKLNSDGTFVYNDFTLFENKAGAYYILDPNWKFIDENETYAVNQYGDLARFTYTEANENNKLGVSFEVLDSTNRMIIDSYYGYLLNPVYCVNNNLLYIFGNNGIIKVYDINNNYKGIGRYDTKIYCEDYSEGEVYRITSLDNDIYLHYYIYSEDKEFEKRITINQFQEYKNIWIKEFESQNNSQNDITTKYNELKSKYDYSQGLFEIEPTWSAPYIAGKLKQGPIDDTLNTLNFFRWLYGVNEVGVNYDKLERSQKGAVVQAATNELTHTPSRPADMDEEFYKEAYSACNVGSTPGDYYNGNCAEGDLNPANSIYGFIDEIYNVSPNSSVGHRLNLLDLGVDRVSFGYCNTFTALSMYYNEDGTVNNNNDFYMYPTAGNFPKQLFKTNQHLSILCNDSYNYDNIGIEIIYDGVSYNQSEFHIERNNVIVFKLPNELINIFGGTYKEVPDCKLNIKIIGLKRIDGDTINIDYDICFYDINNPEEEIVILIGDVNEDGIVNTTDCTIILRYLKGYEKLNETQLLAADVNKDEIVNTTDCTIILRYLKGYENL